MHFVFSVFFIGLHILYLCVDWQVRSAVAESHECRRESVSWAVGWLQVQPSGREICIVTAEEFSVQLGTDLKFFRLQHNNFDGNKLG